MGKLGRLPARRSFTKASEPEERIFGDVCGPFRTKSHGSSSYFLTLLDDHSRRVSVRPISTNSQACRKIEFFVKRCEKEGIKVKTIHTDLGGEFMSTILKDFCASRGITQSYIEEAMNSASVVGLATVA
jgi:transposase InsO family protein